MTIKTIIFDFDGTIADTLPMTFKVFRAVFREYDKKELSDSEIVAMFGPSEPDILRRHLSNRERVNEAIERFYTLYQEEHRHAEIRQPHIEALLRELKEQGYCLAVYTGKSRRSFEMSLELLGWAPLFDLTLTGDDVVRAKPDPEGLLIAMDRLGADKEETIYAGDAEGDIEAGHRAGVKTVAVHWMEIRQSAEFRRKPDALVDSPEAFKRFLAGQG
jgi:pyrophosphatase PpaX